MASYQRPKVPAFAGELSAEIVQMHSTDYRNPAQLRPGGVLIVGAGNSGAEIAMETARGGHQTWMSGRDTGHIPFRPEGFLGRNLLAPLVLRFVFHRLLTVRTPLGRKARPKMLAKGAPLIRVKPKDLAAAGIQRVPRVVGVRDGRPLLEDGRVLDVANVIWCTGFHPGFDWIDLPVFGDDGELLHQRGRGRESARALLRRPDLPVCDVVVDDPRRQPGRGAHRQSDRGAPRCGFIQDRPACGGASQRSDPVAPHPPLYCRALQEACAARLPALVVNVVTCKTSCTGPRAALAGLLMIARPVIHPPCPATGSRSVVTLRDRSAREDPVCSACLFRNMTAPDARSSFRSPATP